MTSSDLYEPRRADPPPGEVLLVLGEHQEGDSRLVEFAFIRANMAVRVEGPVEEARSVAGWLDDYIEAAVAQEGVATEVVADAFISVEGCRRTDATDERNPRPDGKPDLPPVRPRPADDAILRIEQPKSTSVFEALVPDGTRSVRLVVRVLDPRVTKLTISNLAEAVQVSGKLPTVTVEVPLDSDYTVLTVTARGETPEEWHGILGIQSIAVATESAAALYGPPPPESD